MFSAELKSDVLKNLVGIVSTLIDEVKFTVSSDGMVLRAVDPAHIAMIEMNVYKGAFDSFDAQDEQIGLDLDKVKGVLKLASSGDKIRMVLDDEKGRLTFKVGNITRRMTPVDTSSISDPKVPDISLSASLQVAVEELQKGIRAAESISDHIALRAGPDFFELSCEGESDSVSLRLEGSSVHVDTDSEVCSMFPLDYFSNIIKAVPAGTILTIELDNDYPTKIIFDFADGNVKVRYLLAPRIESE